MVEAVPAAHESDLRLVEDTLLGRTEAVERFIERMQCVPLILAARNARQGRPLNDEDLADLAQDTLEVVWRKLSTYSARSSLESWVYSFCVYQMMNAIRSKKRRPIATLDDHAPWEGDATASAASGSPSLDYEHVYRSLERIDRAQADVIRLKHFASLTFEQISARLALPTNTVKAQYYRGLDRLRALLQSHLREEFA